MKMLESFSKQIKKFSKIEKVWFTTFSLNIGFLEKYVLPEIIGSNQPKSMSDYEILEQSLINSEIDIRIFCDENMFRQSELDKNTSVQIYPVSLAYDKSHKLQKGLYHPKVIMILGVDKTGKPLCILGAGSANLTLSGWGRNIEVFIWKRIQDRENLDRVNKFFSGSHRLARLTKSPKIDVPVIAERAEYLFIHSFIKDEEKRSDFIRNLNMVVKKRLDIFSPFFGDDLDKVMQGLRVQEGTQIRIIPDKQKGLRMTRDQYQQFKGILYDYKFDSQHDEMVHAKVWITEAGMAMGSWNMTLPGIGAAGDRNNIEAGFLIDGETESLDLTLSTLTEENLCDDIDEEIESLTKLMPWIPVSVEFDWGTHVYQITYPDTLKEYSCDIKLPGISDTTQLNFTTNPIEIQIQRLEEMIKHKFYEIIDTDKQVRQTGCIIETNGKDRIGWRFPTMGDLFSHYLDGIEKEKSGTSVMTLNNKGTDGSEIFQTADEHGESYFLIFRALYKFERDLDEKRADKNKRKEDKCEYMKMLYSYPYSLSELCDRAGKAIQDTDTTMTVVHRFLLVKELLRIIERQNDSQNRLQPFTDTFTAWLQDNNDQTKGLLEQYEKVVKEDWCANSD